MFQKQSPDWLIECTVRVCVAARSGSKLAGGSTQDMAKAPALARAKMTLLVRFRASAKACGMTESVRSGVARSATTAVRNSLA
jgi:hypothetical protein